jgi:hypothetical protein
MFLVVLDVLKVIYIGDSVMLVIVFVSYPKYVYGIHLFCLWVLVCCSVF